MKQFFLLGTIAFLTLVFVSSINAQTATPRVIRADDEVETTTESTESEAARERLQGTEDEREERRLEFQTKLEEMKDVRKKAMIERVDEKINNFNERHSTKLQTALGRMQSVLDGIATKAATLNDSQLDTAIETAQASIDAAEELVTTQLETEYFIDLENETQVRTAAQAAFTQFRTDLQELHTAVKDAYADVVQAARLLPKTTTMEREEESTSTSEADTTSSEETEDDVL